MSAAHVGQDRCSVSELIVAWQESHRDSSDVVKDRAQARQRGGKTTSTNDPRILAVHQRRSPGPSRGGVLSFWTAVGITEIVPATGGPVSGSEKNAAKTLTATGSACPME